MTTRASNASDGYFLAAMCFYVAALLHLAVIGLSLADYLWSMLLAALFWGVLATALLRHLRTLAWIGFFAALGAGLAALGHGVPTRSLDAAVFVMIAGVLWLGALALAAHLWRYRGAIRQV
ncbi:hypothetical protein [Pseudooceanicola sp. 200-1SW]|uniref:hypothetical protein n=1 Tax=Pseudooceanicola sp. 200-1SW TaxID=3425949 RepID=UPI003D7FCD64